MPGTLFVVATPIGNLDDITLRALRVLREVSVIAAEDTRRTGQLLARHGISTPTTSLHEHNEARKSASLVQRLQSGDDIAVVSDAGTPTVSDPGGRFVREAIEAGIRVEPIPGANAAVAALSASGLITDSFAFVGFPPIRSKDRKIWLQRLEELGGVVVFYEAPHRIHRTLADVQEAVGDRPTIVARELTKTHEELVRGPISTIGDKLSSDKGEFTVIIDLGMPVLRRHKLGEITYDELHGRRALVSDVAARLGVSANELYKAVERLKNIGQ